jgi:hypothetical protein
MLGNCFVCSSCHDKKPVPRTAGLYYSALACQEDDIKMYERQAVEPALQETTFCFLPIYQFCLLRVKVDLDFLSRDEKEAPVTTEDYQGLNL